MGVYVLNEHGSVGCVSQMQWSHGFWTIKEEEEPWPEVFLGSNFGFSSIYVVLEVQEVALLNILSAISLVEP